MNSSYLLEVCVDNLDSARAAIAGGADRIELCADLIIGGTTPHPNLWEQIRRESDIPMRVMIRPRFGDFCYTESEFEIMRESVGTFRDRGAQGVVFGMLQPDGELDVTRMELLCREARGMAVTLHRAFDVCRDPMRALEQAKALGIRTILTSGQAPSALQGRELLRRLQENCGEVEILAGASVSSQNLAEIGAYTGIRSFHLSGKKITESPMRFRPQGIHMGLPGFSEFERWECDAEEIRRAKDALKKLCAKD